MMNQISLEPAEQPQIFVPQQNPSRGPSETFLIFIAVIVILTTGLGAYFLGIKNTQPTSESSTFTQPTTPTPTINPTANWKTYISTEYDFTIKYPSQITHEETLGTTKYNKSHEFFKVDGGTLEIYGVCGRGIQAIKQQDMTIDGQKATKLYETNTNGIITAIPRPNSNESVCFNFTLPSDSTKANTLDSLFNQILSTFTFTPSSPTNENQNQTSLTPTIIPTAPLSTPSLPPRTINVIGLSYLDTNNDHQYNNGEPHLGNMCFQYYDSAQNVHYTFYSNPDGSFSASLSVTGNLVIQPCANLGYDPNTSQQTLTNSAQGIMFGFITAGQVNTNNHGQIEGDVYLDTNRNGVRDADENGISFYKIYLNDDKNDTYNTADGTQTTQGNGHFTYVNLAGGTYTVFVSNPSYIIPQPKVSVTVPTGQTVNNVEIAVQQ